MSWDLLVRAMSRAGGVRNAKTVEVVDEQFDHEEKRYRAMESVILRLEKEMKHYLESLRLLAASQENVSSILMGFHGAQKNTVAQLYHAAMEDLSKLTINELEDAFSQAVMEPLQLINAHCVRLNQAIKKRHWKKADLEALLSKREELRDLPSEDPTYQLDLVDIESEIDERRKCYDYFNEQLKIELPKLVDMRIPYLNPSFEAFVKIQLRFFNENFQKLSDVQGHLKEDTRQLFINEAYEDKMDAILKQINQLTTTL